MGLGLGGVESFDHRYVKKGCPKYSAGIICMKCPMYEVHSISFQTFLV